MKLKKLLFGYMNSKIYDKLSLIEQKLDFISKNVSTFLPSMYGVAAYCSGHSYEDVRMHNLESYGPATGILRDVQKCALCVLKFLKQITDKNKLTFWLHAGTLIGALRHKGFIPWDDDIDIGMMREDFDKLVEIVSKRDDCVIDGFYNDLRCSISYQFRLKSLPIFIDIAVFDGIKLPNNDIITRNNFLEKYRSCRMCIEQDFRNKLKSPAVKNVGLYHCGPYDDRNKQMVDQLLCDYAHSLNPNKDKDYNCVYLGLENYPFPYPVMAKEQMFPLIESVFEDTTFLIPNDSLYYLDGYGDIYECPSDIGQTPHMYIYIKELDKIRSFIEKFEKDVKNEL